VDRYRECARGAFTGRSAPPPEASADRAGSAGSPGLWQRVKDFFGAGTKEESKPDAQDLRARAEELRKRLEEGMPDNAARRLVVLEATVADLTALVRDLLAAGDHTDPVMQLGALVAELPEVLQAAAPPTIDAAVAQRVNQVWQGIVTALRDLLNPAGAVSSGGTGREGFWK
jgi:hypothetical protein